MVRTKTQRLVLWYRHSRGAREDYKLLSRRSLQTSRLHGNLTLLVLISSAGSALKNSEPRPQKMGIFPRMR